MCIAIVTTTGAWVDEPALRSCAYINGDGGGYAYIDMNDGEVKIKKGFFKVEDFIDSYKRTLDEGHGEYNAMLLHFRVATMGAKNTDNCHPFPIKDGALIHNGHLFSSNDPTGKDRSDTRIFTEELFPNFTYERVRDNKDALGGLLRSNKVAMLFKDGNYIILNERYGHWNKDVWYSNHSYTYSVRESHVDTGWRRRRWTEGDDLDPVEQDYLGWPYNDVTGDY